MDVVVEELIFPGVVLGLLLELVPLRWAVGLSAVLFGLWHIAGVILSTPGAGAAALAALGTLAATSAAGLVFAWLRVRSGSLVAPALAHLAVNAMALVVAWVILH